MSWKKKVKKITNKVKDTVKKYYNYTPVGMITDLYDTYKDSVNAQKDAQKLAEQEYQNQLQEQERIKQEELTKRKNLLLQQRQIMGLNTNKKSSTGISQGNRQWTLLDNGKTLG